MLFVAGFKIKHVALVISTMAELLNSVALEAQPYLYAWLLLSLLNWAL